MLCPFCSIEMKKGFISGDGRSRVRWHQEDDKIGIIEQVSSEKGYIANVKYKLFKFNIEGYFCPCCNKIIFDAEIVK